MEKAFVRKFQKELEENLASQKNGLVRFLKAAENLDVKVRIESKKASR